MMSRIPLRPETSAARTLSVIVTALMVTLAIAAIAGAAAVRHVDLDWRGALANRWTVEAPTPAVKEPDASAPDALPPDDPDPAPASTVRITAALRAIPGILNAETVGPDEVARLLAPWLGAAREIRELPMPSLIDVQLDPDNPAQFAIVQQKLSTIAPGARLDDHGSWTRNLTRLGQTAEAVGLSLIGVIAVTTAATVAAAARARVAVNRAEIDLLHLIGASDLYISRQFQIDALRSSILGAMLGASLAAAAGFALVRHGAALAPLLPQLRLERLDWCGMAMAPAAAVLIAIIVTQWTIWALIRRLP